MWAIIFNIWRDDPVWHEPSPIGRARTKCGRPVGNGVPMLPRKHAVLFASACKSCQSGGVRS